MAASLNPSLYKVVCSCLSTLTVTDFYRSLTEALGGQPSFRKPDNFRSIQEEIKRLSLEKKKTPVIIIDEANYVSNGILNDLKLLFNFEMDSKDRAVILLCGLGQLNNTPAPVRPRTPAPAAGDELPHGGHDERGRAGIYPDKASWRWMQPYCFEDAAVEAILNASDGTPRMVNRLCSQSLLCAEAKRRDLVDADAAMQAINDCELDRGCSIMKKKRHRLQRELKAVEKIYAGTLDWLEQGELYSWVEAVQQPLHKSGTDHS